MTAKDPFKELLLKELVQALGCTEPIAIAYACATLKDVLGTIPDSIVMKCSGNIIKNVKAVVIPNSGGEKGILIAAALGAIGGRADKKLRSLEDVTDADRDAARRFVAEGRVSVELVEGEENLYLCACGKSGNEEAEVEIKYDHTRLNRITKNGKTILDSGIHTVFDHVVDTSFLSFNAILDYAENLDIFSPENADLKATLDLQVENNLAIGQEGLNNSYGAEIGRTLIENPIGDPVLTRAVATAAAGSDARMSGCSLPVVINSGSGNQGMTVGVPIAVYAQAHNCSDKQLYSALIRANLMGIHIKRFIGKLSAFCGVVSAACGTGVGLAYLMGLDREQQGMVITNTLGVSGGMVCDGAKPSCAAKIAVALNNVLMSLSMAKKRHVLEIGDGLVGATVEDTIRNFGRMAKIGMKATDVEILKIMIEEDKD